MDPLHATQPRLSPRRPSLASRPAWWFTWLSILGFALLLLTFAALQRGADLFGEIKVGGIVMQRGPVGVAALQAHVARWESEGVTMRVGPYVARATRVQLGATLEADGVREQLQMLGSTGNPFSDFGALLSSHLGGIDLALRPTVDYAKLSERIRIIRSDFERPPVGGTTLSDGRMLPGIPGITINSMNATSSVARALMSGKTELELDVTRVEPPRPRSYVTDDPRNFNQAMITVETTFRTGGASAGRARNIELAANAIHGAVMPPGGELSFNALVGERSIARGFQTAKELANRRVVDGVGGGVCQVAATLHAAAFLSGLALPDYRPHSRPVQYIDLGLDAMVTWPNQDMVIANSYPFPIRVRAQARDGVLQVRLEGSGKAHPVEWHTVVLQRTKPGVQEVSDDSLRWGERVVVQSPIDGMLVRRVRTIYLPTGPKTEEEMLRYPPTSRIVAIGGGNSRGRMANLSSVLDSDEF